MAMSKLSRRRFQHLAGSILDAPFVRGAHREPMEKTLAWAEGMTRT